jgi:coiled-coil domain-containing protein 39
MATEMADMLLDGDSLPPYASEANKQLDAEVKRKQAELENVEDQLESVGARVKTMTDHLINVQQELVNTQQLVDAKKNETSTEEHLKALTNRQLGRLKAEIVRLQKALDDTQDQMNSFSNELMRRNEKLDQFKLEMNWNQEELEQWAIAARQKEEDELTLEKYRRADDTKVRELTLAVEKLTMENAQRRKELADLVTETQAKQIEMDKTAELFRQLHDDRRRLIDQWEESVKSMRSRDSQLERLGEEYASNMARKKQKEDKMKDRKRLYEDTEGENQKLEQTIQQTDRQLVRIRLDHMETKNSLTSFKDEVEVMKNQLQACQTEKTNTQNEHTVLSRNLELRKEKYEQEHRALKVQQKSLEDAQATSKEKEQISAEAERARQEMLQNLKMVEKEMKAAKDSHYKESQELYRLRAEEATTLGEISGAQSAIKNLQLQISKLDQERQRQQELLYAVDFQSQLMQRKVARVSGERTIEEKDEFNKKVEALSTQLEEQKSLHSILTNQNKRQDADLKNANRSLADVKRDCEAIKGTVEELELQNMIINRSVASTVKDKEEALMQHDILRLEVKRLRQQLNSKSENLYSLENRKQQLQISMEEREKEIDVHTEVLKAQLRAAEEERHKAAIELAERKQKIYTLKSKYENVVSKVKKEDGEENLGQAHYMIKAAQEKEELQRRGDELDDKIRRAEKEIRSLENTLGHLVTRNQKYKENFQTANQQNQTELEEKQTLEEQSRAANEVLFKKKKLMMQLEQEAQEDVQRYEELQRNLQSLEGQVQELAGARGVLRQDINAQAAKIDRAQQAVETAKRRATEVGVDLGPESPPTLDIEAKSLKEQNQSVLFALSNVLQDYPEDVLPLFESLCQERGVTRPSRPSSASSRPGSSRLGRGSPPA